MSYIFLLVLLFLPHALLGKLKLENNGFEVITNNSYWRSKASLEDKFGQQDNGGIIFRKFDSRSYWRKCKSIIGNVRDQGKCGTCWATHAASVISDRICIESKGLTKVHISIEDILACCGPTCLVRKEEHCYAGLAYKAFEYLIKSGVVTEECKPYSKKRFDKRPKIIPCVKKCTNASYSKSYNKDKHYAMKWYRVKNSQNVTSIQREIIEYGPVEAWVIVHEDLWLYKKGVYRYDGESKFKYNHFVKIIGWGEESTEPYWLCMNSFGTSWGWKGLFKILKGANMCGIERYVYAAQNFSKVPKSRSWTINPGYYQKPSLLYVICSILCSLFLFI